MNTRNGYMYGLLGLCVLVNISGLWVTIIGPDGALYASIAKTMVQRGNYIELFVEGRDWLDKPHFPFWVSAAFFELFGFTTWAYKLPALLFLFMGVFYTWLFALRLYGKEVALWSVIILLTAEHIIISNNDVRAEPYLTGLIIGSIYHFYRAHVSRHFGHLLAGALFAACAVMTKGMFALIPICGAIAGELIFKKDWKGLFHWRWLLAGVLILLFIVPELYCVYYQFDMHPEKTVFGRQGVSGIRFFFWDSQFGRFFNTGPIKGKGDPFFFVHTVLWAFLPWSVLLYAGIWVRVWNGRKFAEGAGYADKDLAQPHQQILLDSNKQADIEGAGNSLELSNSIDRRGSGQAGSEHLDRSDSNKPGGPGHAGALEWYTISGALLTFLVFSASRFQLPHYMNIVFPLFAIITAGYVLGLSTIRFIRVVQVVIMVVLVLLAVVVHVLFQPGGDWLAVGLMVLGVVCWLVFRKFAVRFLSGLQAILVKTVLVAVWVNLYLNLVFYPALLRYQSGSEVAFYANKHFPGVPVVQFGGGYSYPLEFYLDAHLLSLDSTRLFGPVARPVLVFAPVEAMHSMNWQPVRVFEHFHVSRLTLKLLNHQTREREVERYGLYSAPKE